MKNIFSIFSVAAIVFSLLISSPVQADGPVTKGSSVLGFGLGMAHRHYAFSGFAPGVKVNFEHGIWQAGPGVITLGGTVGFSYQAYRQRLFIGNEYHYSWTSFYVAARSAWHHNWGVDKLDTYAGASAGVRFSIFNDGDDPNPPVYKTVYPHFGGFIGAAYYFKPGLGVFGEFGYDINYLTVGLNLNFGNH